MMRLAFFKFSGFKPTFLVVALGGKYEVKRDSFIIPLKFHLVRESVNSPVQIEILCQHS